MLEQPRASTASSVNVYVPSAVGALESVGVTPGGSVPSKRLTWYGAIPPLRVSVGLYETPTFPSGSDAGVNSIGSQHETSSVSSVTTPVCDSRWPLTDTSLCSVMSPCARIVPTNALCAPRVTEPSTCQNTLLYVAPPLSSTDEPVSVAREPLT